MSIMSRLFRLLQEHSELFRLLYLHIAAMAGGDCWAAGPGLLGSQVLVPVLSAAGLLAFQAAGHLLGSLGAGLPGWLLAAAGFLGC